MRLTQNVVGLLSAPCDKCVMQIALDGRWCKGFREGPDLSAPFQGVGVTC